MLERICSDKAESCRNRVIRSRLSEHAIPFTFVHQCLLSYNGLQVSPQRLFKVSRSFQIYTADNSSYRSNRDAYHRFSAGIMLLRIPEKSMHGKPRTKVCITCRAAAAAAPHEHFKQDAQHTRFMRIVLRRSMIPLISLLGQCSRISDHASERLRMRRPCDCCRSFVRWMWRASCSICRSDERGSTMQGCRCERVTMERSVIAVSNNLPHHLLIDRSGTSSVAVCIHSSVS